MNEIKRGDVYCYCGDKIVVLDVDKVVIRKTKGKVTHRYWVVYCDKYINIDNQLIEDFIRILERTNSKKLYNSLTIANKIDTYISTITQKG